jgi:hypothetical protein
MAASNEALLQGNISIDPNRGLGGIHLPDAEVYILHSGYGVEGVFTNADLLGIKIDELRNLGAYRDERLSISTHEINPK